MLDSGFKRWKETQTLSYGNGAPCRRDRQSQQEAPASSQVHQENTNNKEKVYKLTKSIRHRILFVETK